MIDLRFQIPNLCLALSVLLLAACSSTTQAAKQTPTPSSAVKPVVGRIVEPPPTSCPAGPNPQTVSPDFGPGLGQAPVWAVTFSSGAHGAILLIQSEVTLGEHGYYEKVLWVIQPGYGHIVHLSGSELTTSSSLWFQIGDLAPTTAPALDPSHPRAYPVNPANPDQVFAYYPSYLLIPHAGCYVLEASWPEGHWRIPFAAGGG
jgi:hypothetical protein